jgi:type I restriction enzyme S subunit
MDVKPGFKQTEVGVIPEDWRVTTAAHICELVVDCKNRTPPVVEGGAFAVVRTPNVRNGTFIREDLRFTDEESFREWTMRAIPQVGDVLITREAPLGEVCLVPSDLRVCLGQRMMLYRPDRRAAESHFLLYSLMSPGVQNNLLKKIGGSTVGHAKVDDIRDLQIALPPTKAEQEAIAEALSDANAHIESLEQLITKKRHIKQGAMEELLTGKKRLPGFNGKWVVKRIGEMLSIEHGKSQHAVADPNGIYPILATGGQIGTANRFLYDKPSVLIGRKGTIDQPRYMDQPFWTVDTLFYSVICAPNDAKFLFYRFCLMEWKQHNEASGVPSLNARTIERIEMRIPPPDEQSAIAVILSDMDAEIGALEGKLSKARHIKQGMMQELLTGRIRLR